MKIIMNNNFEIEQVISVSEHIIDFAFLPRLEIRIVYAQSIFEKIKDFLKNNQIFLIEVYNDDNEVSNSFTKYTGLQTLSHEENSNGSNYILLRLREEEEQ